MKRTILLWMAAALLLCGCSVDADMPETTAIPDYSTSAQARPEGYYAPGSALEQQTGGAVRVYPLDIPDCYGLAVMDGDVLVFSGSTQLTLLRGEEQYPAVMQTVHGQTRVDWASAQTTGEGISWFEETTGETVILDESLREITRIPAPEGMSGTPLLSEDRLSMYYCTGEGVWVMDLETEIPRLLRQHTAPLVPEAVLMEGTLLQCAEQRDEGTRTLFLSTETGQLIQELEGAVEVVTWGNRYIANLSSGAQAELVFGTGIGVPQTLHANLHTEVILLPQSQGVLCIGKEEKLQLDYYDLTSGLRSASVTLDAEALTAAADGGEGVIWLLDGENTLYRWDTRVHPAEDKTVYTGIYYTRERPDLAGIAECQAVAQLIGQRHGLEVLVWEDAIVVQPWDYRLTEEYQVPVLQKQLELLDQYLGNFPEGFLAQLSESCGGLTICLVREIQGDLDYSTLDDASGLQFWMEDHAYIALSTVSATEKSLYHELCHVIDTRIIAQCNAYDQWEALNPSGFRYDYDYAANAVRNAGEYLRESERCFIDTYSMSFPKEDRARILEYAMTPGNEGYFQSKTMQAKLMQICLGFREAFGLKKSGETFLWEQYLAESLAYEK